MVDRLALPAPASPEVYASPRLDVPERRARPPIGRTDCVPARPSTDLDAFMAQALTRRDVDRQTAGDYVLDEVETFEVTAPGHVRLSASAATIRGTSGRACTSAVLSRSTVCRCRKPMACVRGPVVQSELSRALSAPSAIRRTSKRAKPPRPARRRSTNPASSQSPTSWTSSSSPAITTSPVNSISRR